MSIDPPPSARDDSAIQVPRTRQLLTPIRTADAAASRQHAIDPTSGTHRSATYHYPAPPHSAIPRQTADPSLAVPPAAAHNRVISMDAATGEYYQSPQHAAHAGAAARGYHTQSHQKPTSSHHQYVQPPSSQQSNEPQMRQTHSRHSSAQGDRHAVPVPPSAPPSSAQNASQNPQAVGLQRIRRTTLNTTTGDWALGKTIGAGSMGKVKLAWNMATNETVCLCYGSIHNVLLSTTE